MVDLIVDDPLFHVLELFGFLDYEFVVLFSYKKFFLFQNMLVSLVHKGGFASVYGIAWAMCMWGMSLVVPSFASELLGHLLQCL